MVNCVIISLYTPCVTMCSSLDQSYLKNPSYLFTSSSQPRETNMKSSSSSVQYMGAIISKEGSRLEVCAEAVQTTY